MFSFNNEGILENNFSNPFMWIEFAISIIVILFLNYAIFRLLKRRMVKVISIFISLLLIISFVFSMTYLWTIVVSLMVVTLVICFNVNLGVVRPYVANTLSTKTEDSIPFFFKRKKKNNVDTNEKIFDRTSVYDKVETAVIQLSSSRTGALITFEKETKLTDYAKNGTILNAPVTPELLVTIFYPGTRLHDGAVIIRRDLIYAAAVYYDPITSGLTGKYGSRHRAALGISKATDSVTIVVSEETGRISLAVGGELIHVSPSDFRRVFDEYMSNEKKE